MIMMSVPGTHEQVQDEAPLSADHLLQPSKPDLRDDDLPEPLSHRDSGKSQLPCLSAFLPAVSFFALQLRSGLRSQLVVPWTHLTSSFGPGTQGKAAIIAFRSGQS